MSIFIYTFLVLLGFLFFRLMLKRCYIYYYVYVDDKKDKILLGYLKSDGTIIDVHQPRGSRRVGKVYVNKEGRGMVRLYDPELESEYREVGYVTKEGRVYTVLGSGEHKEVARVEQDGQSYWWEFWLRRRAEVPLEDAEPLGHCIETGRLRQARPNEITLLARGAAVLLLYFQEARPPEEAAELPPVKIWDTAFPATVIYLFLFFVLRAVSKNFLLFPFLGTEVSLLLTLVGFYFLLWFTLHVLKLYFLSDSDTVIQYLILPNRYTGITKWNIVLIFFSFIGCIYSFIGKGYSLFPMYFSILFGVGINLWAMTFRLWPVVTPFPVRPVPPEIPLPEKGVTRQYSWTLDSPLRNLDFHFKLYFIPEEIQQIRRQNPFYQNWEESTRHWLESAKEVILNGMSDDRVKQVVHYCTQQINQFALTRFEQLQIILDFVQEPNIKYVVDAESQAIGNKGEYIRFPVETLFDKEGDCDCKSALAVALFRTMGFPVLVLVGDTHAAIAVGGAPDLPLEDMNGILTWKGKRYYYCETTGDHWTIGVVPESSQAMMDKEETDVIEFF